MTARSVVIAKIGEYATELNAGCLHRHKHLALLLMARSLGANGIFGPAAFI